MKRYQISRIAMRCSTGILMSAIILNATAHAQQNVIPAGKRLQIDEIIVAGERRADDLTTIAPDAASLLATPGDVNDPLKALLSLPGITFSGGDLDEPIIRGGGTRDNLFLIDGLPVENIFHELSDSIVSPNIIRTFDLQSVAFNSEYGNATGGVIDIGLRDPSADHRRANIDLSQLKSGILIETPITDNIAAYGSYRHNLAHLFLKEFERGNDVLVFQMPKSRDYTGRVIWRGGETDVTVTGLGAWDKTEERPREGNVNAALLGEVKTRRLDAQSLRLRTRLGENTNLTAVFSHSRTHEDRRERNGSFAERTTNTLTLRSKLIHQTGQHRLAAGTNLTFLENDLSFKGFIPICDRLEQNCGGAFSANPATLNESYQTTELYFEDQIYFGESLTVDLGLHGAVDHFLDETFIEPRLGLTFSPAENIDLYARAGLHHVSPEPRRLLLLGGLGAEQESERSKQVMVGQRWAISDEWRLQTEIWYKDFKHSELIGSPLERDFKGEAYGLDILLAKPISNRLYGWAALSLSKGTVTDIVSGLTVDNQFTPQISATIAVTYAFDNGWKLGAKYRMQSGDPFTPLLNVGIDPISLAPRPSFGVPFSKRLDTYHRLDIRIEKSAGYQFADVTYYVDILNVTNRKNIANRSFLLRNTVFNGPNTATIIPDDEQGIPFFVAFGVNFSF